MFLDSHQQATHRNQRLPARFLTLLVFVCGWNTNSNHLFVAHAQQSVLFCRREEFRGECSNSLECFFKYTTFVDCVVAEGGICNCLATGNACGCDARGPPPTLRPTPNPTNPPTRAPTPNPTKSPTLSPTLSPTIAPIILTNAPTVSPRGMATTNAPVNTIEETMSPTDQPILLSPPTTTTTTTPSSTTTPPTTATTTAPDSSTASSNSSTTTTTTLIVVGVVAGCLLGLCLCGGGVLCALFLSRRPRDGSEKQTHATTDVEDTKMMTGVEIAVPQDEGDLSTLGDPLFLLARHPNTNQSVAQEQSTTGFSSLGYEFQQYYQQRMNNNNNNNAPSIASPRYELEVVAPAGALGLILESSKDGGQPWIHKVKPESVLQQMVQVGDRILLVDGQDVTAMTANRLSRLIASKGTAPKRTLLLSRKTGNNNNNSLCW